MRCVNTMTKLSELPNIGKVLEANLIAVGITTHEELRAAGTITAFMRIKTVVDPGACVQMLYGIEGAVQGIRDRDLPQEKKSELKEFFRSLK